jgi:hypothetical protein
MTAGNLAKKSGYTILASAPGAGGIFAHHGQLRTGCAAIFFRKSSRTGCGAHIFPPKAPHWVQEYIFSHQGLPHSVRRAYFPTKGFRTGCWTHFSFGKASAPGAELVFGAVTACALGAERFFCKDNLRTGCGIHFFPSIWANDGFWQINTRFNGSAISF